MLENIKYKNWLIGIAAIGAVTTITIVTVNSYNAPRLTSEARKSGDSILFERGYTYYGAVNITKSNVFVGAYGEGEKPVITSLITLDNWVSKGGGIWEAASDSRFGSTVNLVLIDGVQQQIGRYPNVDAANKGYLNFESHVGTTSITDNEFRDTTSWAGAELVVRPRRWVIDRSKITSNTATKISYSPAISLAPFDKMGYFIQNSIKTLDKFGEWYYNPSTKKLSIFFGSNNPNDYNVQATSITNLISSNNISNVVFDNLTIKGANENGFNIISGSNIKVQNCDILFSGKTGIIANMHDKFTIENSTISNSNHKGLDLGFSSDYAVVRNNKILSTGMIAGMSGNYDGSSIGIYSWGTGNVIEYNEIRNSGYDGMYINGSDIIIRNNFIDSFCITKDDGAGIYTHGAPTVQTNRKITGNIIMNGIGAGAGTASPTVKAASGIYLDNKASATEVSGNTITRCGKDGVYIHNVAGTTVRNNTTYDNPASISITEDPDGEPVRNVIIVGNTLFSKTIDQMATKLTGGVASFGRFDSNVYARPIDDRLQITIGSKKLDLEDWKKTYSKDAASKITAKQIAAYKVNSLIGQTKFANGSFNSNITGVSSTASTLAYSTSGGLDGGCVQVTPTASKSQINVKIGSITAGKKYILRYSVKGTTNNMVMGAYLRQLLSPYNVLVPSQYRNIKAERSDNEFIFIAPSSQANVVAILSADQQSRYYVDNVQIYEADAVITNVEDSIKFVNNPTQAAKTFSLGANYVDAKGNGFDSITLQPYTSSVLIWKSVIVPPVDTIPPVDTTANKPPVVTIKGSYSPPNIKLSASATDTDGTITRVEFLRLPNVHIYFDSSAPYLCNIGNWGPGVYQFVAKAKDNSGNVTTSSPITITVN